MSGTDSYHRPVLADEVVGYLVTRRDGTYIDATAGGGSHTALVLSRLLSSARVLAIDCDDDAVARTIEKTKAFASQVTVMRGEFAGLEELAHKAGMASVNGILFDLGVSSHQLNSSDRGFSYRETGPLDFRMDRRGTLTASDIINDYPAERLARIFFEFGGEKNARKIAAAIDTARRRDKISTTTQLATVIAAVTNPRYLNKTFSRVYQSIRIVVNDEISQLQNGLQAAVNLLADGSRLVVISYHSIEDRIVKNFFRDRSGKMPAAEIPAASGIPVLKVITKKPVTARPDEVRENPRARSAKMRVAERIRHDA